MTGDQWEGTMLEGGTGAPVLYLHGLVDVHGTASGWLPFHKELLTRCRLIAPAHPGCHGAGGLEAIDDFEDVVFHYLDLARAFGLDRFNLVGVSIGGWIAAELAVRTPERVGKLVLIAATGLHVPGTPIADLFYADAGKRVGDRSELRDLLFGDGGHPIAKAHVPDVADVTLADPLWPETLRFAAHIGWKPPYLHDRKLRRRLRRIECPVLTVWGRRDRLVPIEHGRAYAREVAQGELRVIEGAGHSVHVENPSETAALVTGFLAG